MELLNRDCTLIVKKVNYSVNFPKVSDILNIEVKKSELSRGQYGSMMESGTLDASIVVGLINAYATFSVVCPKLIEDLKVNFLDLDLGDAMELLNVYTKQYFPWYKGWRDEFSKVIEG